MSGSRAREEWEAAAKALEDVRRMGDMLAHCLERAAREKADWKRDCLTAEERLGRLQGLVLQLLAAHPDEPGMAALGEEVRRQRG